MNDLRMFFLGFLVGKNQNDDSSTGMNRKTSNRVRPDPRDNMPFGEERMTPVRDPRDDKPIDPP